MRLHIPEMVKQMGRVGWYASRIVASVREGSSGHHILYGNT